MPLELASVVEEVNVNVSAEDRAKEILKMHERVRRTIELNNEKVKGRKDKGRKEVIFQPGDLVWVHLRKDRFPVERKSKLAPRADGPFRILEKINDNAYKVELPSKYGVSSTFNVGDLERANPEGSVGDLRANPPQQGEDVTRTITSLARGIDELCFGTFTNLAGVLKEPNHGEEAETIDAAIGAFNGRVHGACIMDEEGEASLTLIRWV